MQIKIGLTEKDVRCLVMDHLRAVLPEDVARQLTSEDVILEVKSKQNFKSEWEVALFRVQIDKEINQPL